MSNYLAIATVTAVLQRMLQAAVHEDVPGAIVTTVRPDGGASNQITGINIYMYLAVPNPAWRNADLRTRRPKGELVKHGQAGLDLHYLLTFYGNEQELEPQRLFGSAVRTLVDQPILTQQMIQDVVESPDLAFLANSTLAEQVQTVMLIPSNMTSEEMSRIWSIFFQTPYSLSFAFQGTAVLIQGEKSGRVALPVRRLDFSLAAARPVIDRIEPKRGDGLKTDRTVTLDSTLLIHGQQLLRYEEQSALEQPDDEFTKVMVTRIKIGETVLIPQEVEVSDRQVRLDLSCLSEAEIESLRAGVQGIQVIHNSLKQHILSFESNVLPLVLCPVIASSHDITVVESEQDDEGLYRGEIQIQTDLRVAPRQRIFLLLNGLDESSQTYIFRAIQPTSSTRLVRFPIQAVGAGNYLVRIQIDGAESNLEFDPQQQQFVSPTVSIGNEP